LFELFLKYLTTLSLLNIIDFLELFNTFNKSLVIPYQQQQLLIHYVISTKYKILIKFTLNHCDFASHVKEFYKLIKKSDSLMKHVNKSKKNSIIFNEYIINNNIFGQLFLNSFTTDDIFNILKITTKYIVQCITHIENKIPSHIIYIENDVYTIICNHTQIHELINIFVKSKTFIII
jgi:hypothetical protein